MPFIPFPVSEIRCISSKAIGLSQTSAEYLIFHEAVSSDQDNGKFG